MKSIQLEADQRQFILNAIQVVFPNVEIIIVGSRVRGEAKTYSDLDVALQGLKTLNPLQLLKLQEIFDESKLPFKVDVLDLRAVTDGFREHIEKTGERII